MNKIIRGTVCFMHFRQTAEAFCIHSAVGVDDIAPVQIAALQAMDEYLGRGDIGRDGDIVYVAQAQQIHFIGLMGLRADRVSEEEQQVDLVAGDARSDLLVAPMGAGQKTLDAQARGLRHKLARRTCRAQIVLGKHAAVVNNKLPFEQ